MKSDRLAWATALAPLVAASLQDVKHIVLFMQENRAFDHVSTPREAPGSLGSNTDQLTRSHPQYFGTMPGVRGFGDPNVQINSDNRSVFEQ